MSDSSVRRLSLRIASQNGWTFPLTERELEALDAVVRAGYMRVHRWGLLHMKIDAGHKRTLTSLFRGSATRAWDALPEEERTMRVLGGQRRPRQRR